MDSGDDATYQLGPAEHAEDLHPGEPGGTFHAESGEVWHKPYESSGSKQTSIWLTGVSVATLGGAAFRNVLCILPSGIGRA